MLQKASNANAVIARTPVDALYRQYDGRVASSAVDATEEACRRMLDGVPIPGTLEGLTYRQLLNIILLSIE